LIRHHLPLRHSDRQGLTEGINPSLDSIQAYYLWAVFSIFYVGLDESRKTRHDFDKLVDLARNSGYFRSSSQSENTSKSWEEWVHEEKRKRYFSAQYFS
jgi:hypothetical protein